MKHILLALMLLLPASAFGQSMTITENWGTNGFSWNRTGSNFIIRFVVVNSGGKAMICVAGAGTAGSPAKRNKEVLRRAYVEIGGTKERLLRNLSFARIHSSRHVKSRLVGQPANCKLTDKAFPQNPQGFRLVLAKETY